MRRLLLVGLAVAAVCLAGFALWGDSFEQLLAPEALSARFARWLWLAAPLLLASDLLLPIPATAVLAVLGTTYGATIGTALGTLGLLLAGWAGFGVGRLPAIRDALVDADERARYAAWFDRWGPLAVIASRPLPVLPEVVAVLAGLGGMRLSRFSVALLLGSAPTAALFATLGATAPPLAALVAATLAPLLVWLLVERRIRA